MRTHEPKLCPRCESDDVLVHFDGDWYAECLNCGLIEPYCISASEAARKWNEIPDEPEEDRRRWRG